MATKEETQKDIVYNGHSLKCNTTTTEIKGTKQDKTSLTDLQTNGTPPSANNNVQNRKSTTLLNRRQETTTNHGNDSTSCRGEDRELESSPRSRSRSRTRAGGTKYRSLRQPHDKSFNTVRQADVQSNPDTESDGSGTENERGETRKTSASGPPDPHLKNPDPRHKESAATGEDKETRKFDRICPSQLTQEVRHVAHANIHSNLREGKNRKLTGETADLPGEKQDELFPENSRNSSAMKTSARHQTRRPGEFVPANSDYGRSGHGESTAANTPNHTPPKHIHVADDSTEDSGKTPVSSSTGELSSLSQSENQSSTPAVNPGEENAIKRRSSFEKNGDHPAKQDSVPESSEATEESGITHASERVLSDRHASAQAPENPSSVEVITASSTMSTEECALPRKIGLVAPAQTSPALSLGANGSTSSGTPSSSHLNVEGLASEASDEARENDVDGADDTNSESDHSGTTSERLESSPCQSPPASYSNPFGINPCSTPLPPHPDGAAEGTETEAEAPPSFQRSHSHTPHRSQPSPSDLSHPSPTLPDSPPSNSSLPLPLSPGPGEEEAEGAVRGIESEIQRCLASYPGCECQPWHCVRSDTPLASQHSSPSQTSLLPSSPSPGEEEPEGAVGGVDTENQQCHRSFCPTDRDPSRRVSSQLSSNVGAVGDQRRQHGPIPDTGLQLRSHISVDSDGNPAGNEDSYSVKLDSNTVDWDDRRDIPEMPDDPNLTWTGRHPEIVAVTRVDFRPDDQEAMAGYDVNYEASISSLQEHLLTGQGYRVTISDLTVVYNWGTISRPSCMYCSQPVDVRLVCCYHAVLCRSCANRVVQCPLCNADIVAISRLNH